MEDHGYDFHQKWAPHYRREGAIRCVYECLGKSWIRLYLIDAKAPTAHDRKGEEQSVLFAYYIVGCYIVHQLLIHI